MGRRAQYQKQIICARENTYLPSLSISNIISYINEATLGDRDVEKREFREVIYIYIIHPTTTIIPR